MENDPFVDATRLVQKLTMLSIMWERNNQVRLVSVENPYSDELLAAKHARYFLDPDRENKLHNRNVNTLQYKIRKRNLEYKKTLGKKKYTNGEDKTK